MRGVAYMEETVKAGRAQSLPEDVSGKTLRIEILNVMSATIFKYLIVIYPKDFLLVWGVI
jgi:hypothetical protein